MSAKLRRVVDITVLIRAHEREYAPGSESLVLGAYRDDCVARGIDIGSDEIAPRDFGRFWEAVCRHDWDRASLYGEVGELSGHEPQP